MLNLWCLHGNLQRPTVWNSPIPKLWAHPQINVLPIDLWSTPTNSLWDWGQWFCHHVQTQNDPPHVIIGYSLGGRLAYHALLANPKTWAGSIIINADPGLNDAQARADCLQRDQQWGQRFLTEPWAALLQQWDQLPVFQGQANPITRQEQDFSRAEIARVFDHFSKGRQTPLAEKLRATPAPPLLYLSGALDPKYRAIGDHLAAHSHIHHISIPGAAHRVPWENSPAFEQVVYDFLTELSSRSVVSSD